MKRRHQDLRMRILINGTSALLLAFFIFVAHYTILSWFFVAAIASIGAIATWEYDRFAKKKGLYPAIYLNITAVILYIFAVFFKTRVGPFTPLLFYGPEIILGISFFACFVYYAIIQKPPIVNIATTFFGTIYIGVPLGLFIAIMYFFYSEGAKAPHIEGSWWIVYLLIVTKSADIGGYFVGSYFGKRKLAFKLSPNKTLEGAVGGVMSSIAMSLLICFLAKNYGGVFGKLSYVWAVWLGLIVCILGQMGDLAESLLKRDANLKDSNTIPGVGGALDMIDSLLFTTPFLYIFLRFHDYYN